MCQKKEEFPKSNPEYIKIDDDPTHEDIDCETLKNDRFSGFFDGDTANYLAGVGGLCTDTEQALKVLIFLWPNCNFKFFQLSVSLGQVLCRGFSFYRNFLFGINILDQTFKFSVEKSFDVRTNYLEKLSVIRNSLKILFHINTCHIGTIQFKQRNRYNK